MGILGLGWEILGHPILCMKYYGTALTTLSDPHTIATLYTDH